MAVDLVFGELGAYTPPPGGAVQLVLGETEGASGTLTDATLYVTLRVSGTISAAQLQPYPGGTARAPWGAANRSHGTLPRLPWRPLGTRPASRTVLAWSAFGGLRSVRSRSLPWGLASVGFRAPPMFPWGKAGPALVARRLPWEPARWAGYAVRAPWQPSAQRQRGAAAPWQAALRALRVLWAPWGRAALLPAVNRPLPIDPDDYGFTPRGTGPVHLHFCELAGTQSLDLVFNGEVCTTRPRIPDDLLIASRTTYMHTHSLNAWRLPDLTPVPLTGFSLQADEGSFGWTLEAQGPVSILSLLAPSGSLPAQLRVTLDGLTWEFIVEGLRRTRTFGETAATITGRSASALLGEPYSPSQAWLNATPATAQQIINEALQFTGVTLDWQCTDWTVPAGAWSFTGTPLAVVRAVAESIGAIVRSPRTGSTIAVVPRYPVLPWAWASATPDVTIALDAVVSDGYERADRPAYEGVYVSGQAQGVLALVKRTGTAPALLLPLVTDPLITALDAARQRGEALLGAVGPQANMTLTLPVLTGSGEPGVIDVNKLVLVDGWKGRVRGVSVQASHTGVRQTLAVERKL